MPRRKVFRDSDSDASDEESDCWVSEDLEHGEIIVPILSLQNRSKLNQHHMFTRASPNSCSFSNSGGNWRH